MEVIIVAIIVSVISPLILGFLTNQAQTKARKEEFAQRRIEKKEDWRREDAVVEQAAEAAALLVKSNALTNVKLDTIHTLVNSNMTAAMQSELDATIRELAMMKEVVSLKEAAGHKPLPEALSAISLTEQKVSELGEILADRTLAANLINKQK